VRVRVIASGASVFFRTAGVPVTFRILGSVAADIDSRVTREGAAVGILGTGRLLQQPIATGGNPNYRRSPHSLWIQRLANVYNGLHSI